MYEHDSIKPFEGKEGSKKEQVADMFNQIAHRYDFLNRFLSAGIDVGWRKKAIKQLAGLLPATLLDVATGTADVALMAKNMLPSLQQVTGIDISDGMLELVVKKLLTAS